MTLLMKETTVIFNYCWSLCYQRNKETHGVVPSMSLQRVLKGAVSDPNCTRGDKQFGNGIANTKSALLNRF